MEHKGLYLVSIGIQARSTSKRLPGKVGEFIQKKTVLQHVIDSCVNAANYINNWNTKKMIVDLALLIPEGDPISVKAGREISIIEGQEHDVLSRYVELQKRHNSDFVVRITADCPMLPPFMISKLITLAVTNHYDYVSNVDERCRTVPDGYDVEVLSKKMIHFLNDAAEATSDREHVTTLIRREPPHWASIATIVTGLNLSSLKLSVDTDKDLEHVRIAMGEVDDIYKKAIEIFGRKNVHRV